MNNKDGFTLLEVLIALVILGISFSILINGFIKIDDSLDKSNTYTYLSSWAENKLNELTSGMEYSRSGYFIWRSRKFDWWVEEDYNTTNLIRLELIIEWSGKKAKNRYSISDLIYRGG